MLLNIVTTIVTGITIHRSLHATTPCSYHGVFTDQSIFSLNSVISNSETGTSLANCNHEHGLMLTCRHVHVRPHCFILTEACSCRLELAYFAGKISKNRLVWNNAFAMAYYRSCRLLMYTRQPCYSNHKNQKKAKFEFRTGNSAVNILLFSNLCLTRVCELIKDIISWRLIIVC